MDFFSKIKIKSRNFKKWTRFCCPNFETTIKNFQKVICYCHAVNMTNIVKISLHNFLA